MPTTRNLGPMLQHCMEEHANGRAWDDLSDDAQEAMTAVAEDFAAAIERSIWRDVVAAARTPTGFAMTADQRYALDLILAEIERAARAAGVDLPAGDAGA